MFKTSLFFVFIAVALAQSDSLDGMPGSGRQLMSGTAVSNSGLGIRYRTFLNPADASLVSFGGGVISGPNAFHRYMADKGGAYFGYDLVIALGDSANSYVATFQPLSVGRRVTPLPQYPAPQVVREGDIIELDLMVSPDGKQRLTDYIEILGRVPESAPAVTTAEPRDFTLDDGPVKVDASRMSIWINGQKFQGKVGFTKKSGATFWIVLPEQGRYVLSLIPQEGFVKSGTVRDNVISFEAGGQQCELRLMSPIAGAGKAWNLHVLHDQAFRWTRSNEIAVGVDRLENLLPRP